jgi:hypothetical protein
MLRTKRRTAGNLTALLLGVGGMIACVSGTTENGGTDDGGAVCEPACSPGLICVDGTCVFQTGSGGTGAGAGPTGGGSGVNTGGANGGQPTGGAAGAGVGGGGNEGGIGGTNGGAGGFGNAGNGGSGAVSGGGTGGAGNTGGQGGNVGGQGGTGGATGGTAGKGGTSGSSGSAGKGGTGGSGGSAGKGGSGQAGFTSCNIGGQHNGDGSFTWYHFSQGTGQENGAYVTACGFRAPTSGTSGTQDTVENIANDSPASNHYFVAIPAANPQNFSTAEYCGACVELTGQNGTKVVATVVDMCPINSNPRCSQGAHLDVSKTAFDRLGYSVGDPTNTTWRFVPCPISGNVKVRMKSGNNNEFFVEGGITSITNVTVNGTAATRTYYGAWHVNSAISHPATLGLTDKAGRQLTVTLNNSTSNQDTGAQFPRCQ